MDSDDRAPEDEVTATFDRLLQAHSSTAGAWQFQQLVGDLFAQQQESHALEDEVAWTQQRVLSTVSFVLESAVRLPMTVPTSTVVKQVWSLMCTALDVPEAREQLARLQGAGVAIVSSAHLEALLGRIRALGEAALLADLTNSKFSASQLGGVSLSSATPDASQPASGSLNELHGVGATAAAAAPGSSVEPAEATTTTTTSSSSGSPRDRAAMMRSMMTVLPGAAVDSAMSDAPGLRAGRQPPAAPSLPAAPKAKRDPLAAFDEMVALRSLLYWLLATFPRHGAAAVDPLLRFIRRAAQQFEASVSSSETAAIAAPTSVGLQVLLAMLRGVASQPPPLQAPQQQQQVPTALDLEPLVEVLLPLHLARGVLPDGTTPVLSVFHEQLTQCVLCLLRLSAGQGAAPPVRRVLQGLCAAWEAASDLNSAASILLMRELETALLKLPSFCAGAAGQAPDPSAMLAAAAALLRPAATRDALLQTTAKALRSENSRVAQMALGMFRVPLFLRAVIDAAAPRGGGDGDAGEGGPSGVTVSPAAALLQSLLRGGELHWNVTVNKQTHAAALQLIDALPPAALRRLVAELGWGGGEEEGEGAGNERAAVGVVSGSTAATYAPATAGETDAEGFAIPAPRRSVVLPTSAARRVAADAAAPAVPHEAPVASPLASQAPPGRLPPMRAPVPLPQQPPPHAPGLRGAADSMVAAAWMRGAEAGAAPAMAGAGGKPARPQPPVTITGVAPWAFPQAQAPSSGGMMMSLQRHHHPPAAAVAGVGSVHVTQLSSHAASAQPPLSAVAAPTTAAAPRAAAAADGAKAAPAALAAFPRLARLVVVFRPVAAPFDPTQYGGARGASPAALLASLPHALSPAPTLLPELAFHDLVFGRALGSGSFSTVMYAKHIRRGLPAALWPEYAVKVISTTTMQALGYEAAVQREMAVLASLSHPNLARLVSAFRWRDGAYLVLEYAPLGDLHDALRALEGPLDEPTARAVMGEVLAGLCAVHDAGFAFGDVKPENIVLLEDSSSSAPEGGAASAAGESPAQLPLFLAGGSGAAGGGGGLHAKLTDFGACRPLTAAARRRIAESRGVLTRLRDGDWRAQGVPPAASSSPLSSSPPHLGGRQREEGEEGKGSDNDDSDDDGGDDRLEGTVEYLAPELSHARSPSVASDAFAFGVTLYQVLSGRLPDAGAMWPESQGNQHRGVHFGGVGGPPAAAEEDGSGLFLPSVPSAARGLIRGLLHPDPEQRLGGGPGGMREVAEHPWFSDTLGGPLAVFELCRRVGPPVPPEVRNRGTGSSGGDAAWARRHNSTMWSPLPRAYTSFTSDGGGGGRGAAAGQLHRHQHQHGGAGAGAGAPCPTLQELCAMQVLPPLAGWAVHASWHSA